MAIFTNPDGTTNYGIDTTGGGYTPYATGTSSYDVNPQPQPGTGVYGSVPGPVSLPNPFKDLSGVYPGLGATNQQLSDDILAKLSGQLSPGTINSIQDTAAQWGVGSGMPGFRPGSLTMNGGLRNLGLLAENQIQQGIQDYNSTIPTVSRTQTVDPATQIALAERNATMASAPNPSLAGTYAQNLFNQYLQSMRGPGGGTRGGVGSPSQGTMSGGGYGGGGFTPSMPMSPVGGSSGAGSSGGYDPTQQDFYWMGLDNGSTDVGYPGGSDAGTPGYWDFTGGGYDTEGGYDYGGGYSDAGYYGDLYNSGYDYYNPEAGF